MTRGGKTVTVRTLALIDVLPEVNGQYALYFSSVSAPADVFDQELPMLLGVWRSWKTDGEVFRKRLEAALKDMKEANRLLREADAARSRASARANDDWSEVIRGTARVIDRKYDNLKEVDARELDGTLRHLNEHEGWERWKVIPLRDLNNP